MKSGSQGAVSGRPIACGGLGAWMPAPGEVGTPGSQRARRVAAQPRTRLASSWVPGCKGENDFLPEDRAFHTVAGIETDLEVTRTWSYTRIGYLPVFGNPPDAQLGYDGLRVPSQEQAADLSDRDRHLRMSIKDEVLALIHFTCHSKSVDFDRRGPIADGEVSQMSIMEGRHEAEPVDDCRTARQGREQLRFGLPEDFVGPMAKYTIDPSYRSTPAPYDGTGTAERREVCPPDV